MSYQMTNITMTKMLRGYLREAGSLYAHVGSVG